MIQKIIAAKLNKNVNMQVKEFQRTRIHTCKLPVSIPNSIHQKSSLNGMDQNSDINT